MEGVASVFLIVSWLLPHKGALPAQHVGSISSEQQRLKVRKSRPTYIHISPDLYLLANSSNHGPEL